MNGINPNIHINTGATDKVGANFTPNKKPGEIMGRKVIQLDV